MRNTIVVLLLLALMQPMLTHSTLDDTPLSPQFTTAGSVDVIDEVEPNNVNTSGQEVYPGDVLRGDVDMWDDRHDYFTVWLESGQTLLLTLSHASGDGVSMSVWDEESTHLGASNPGKTRDTLFLGEEETADGGQFTVSVNATMTEAGGGAYVLEIDAGYMVNWYAPEVGWNAATEMFDAKGNLMYTSSLSSYQFAEAASSVASSAPTWTNGDFWNYSVSMPAMFGVTYDEYSQMTVTGSDTVSGKECYRVSLVGKMTLTMNLGGMSTTTIDEESGNACYAKADLSLVHENISITSSIEMSGGGFGTMSETSGRSCTDDWGDPDEDCDGVADDWDDCPQTVSGAEVDAWGCSDAQNGGGNGGGDGSGNGGGNGGIGGLDCIPDMSGGVSDKTVFRSDLTFANGMDGFNFPIVEGTVWGETAVGAGSISMSTEVGGCELFSFDIPVTDALPLNYRHLSTQDFTVGVDTVTAHGIQVFAGREGNNDWATPDFTLLQSVPDDVAKMGLPFAAWINVVGFNEFDSSVNMSGSVNAAGTPIIVEPAQLTIDDVGAVVVDTMGLSSGEYILTITGSSNGGAERSVTVPFTVDNDPDFEIVTMDPWIVLPQGVPWVIPTPIFLEPVNGFGADVSVSVTVPEGVTAQLDFASGSTPFMSVLTLTIPANLSAGDYTVIVTGTAGSTVHSDEITFTLTSLPEFSLDIEDREQIITDGTMSVAGVINAHNGLDLALGGALEVFIEPYNQALLDSAVIQWGTMTADGDLPFTVVFTVDDTIDRNEYTVNLNVIALDGGVTHTASVAFVTESSTLDGTAVVADASAVVSGNTSQHDGTEETALAINNGDDVGDKDDSSDTSTSGDDKESNTALIVGSSIGIIGIIVGIAVVVLRGRSESSDKDFSQQVWNDEPAAQQPMMQTQPQQPVQQMQPVQQQPVQPVQQQQPVQPAPAGVTTAPPPPTQPTTVADYTGLPPGGTYDQSTGQTIYIQPDGVQWQMMGDGSFNRL